VWGFFGACRGGHLDLVKLMIDRVKCHIGRGFEIVCETGRRDMVHFFIEKGVSMYGLCGACRGGHIDLVNFLIENSPFAHPLAHWFNPDWKLSLREASFGGHMDIVNLLIDNGYQNWDDGLCGACEGGHQSIVEFMIQKGAQNWNAGLHGALYGCTNSIVERGDPHKKQLLTAKMMIKRGANDFDNIEMEDLVLLLNDGLYFRWFGNQMWIEHVLKKQKDDIRQVKGLLYYVVHQDVIRFIVVSFISFVP
jgi:hypothetical protein